MTLGSINETVVTDHSAIYWTPIYSDNSSMWQVPIYSFTVGGEYLYVNSTYASIDSS